MKVKIGDIHNSVESLGELLHCEIESLKAYQIRKLIKEIETELLPVEQTRQNLVEKYGELDEDGNKSIKANTEAAANFFKEISVIFDKKVDIKSLDDFEISIEDLAGNKLKPAFFTQLDWLIK